MIKFVSFITVVACYLLVVSYDVVGGVDTAGAGPLRRTLPSNDNKQDNDIALLFEAVESLRQEDAALRKESDAHKQKGKALEQESNALRKESKALRKESDDLRQECEALRHESEALRHESKAHKRKGEALERKTVALERELAFLKAERGHRRAESSCIDDAEGRLKINCRVIIASGNLVIRNGNLLVQNGMRNTETSNGLGNIIVGYNKDDQNEARNRTGSHNVIIGDEHEYTKWGGLVAGFHNSITGNYSSVMGGSNNIASNSFSSVTGGVENEASGKYSSVTGGAYNNAIGQSTSAAGGFKNKAAGVSSSITAGYENVASGDYSSVMGGRNNKAIGELSSITGGTNNLDCSPFGCVWRQVGSDVNGPNAFDYFGKAVSFSNDGTRFAAGIDYHDSDGLSDRGLVRIYDEEGGKLTQIGLDLLGDSAGDFFGYSVSMSGDGKRVAVGAPLYDDNTKGDNTGQTQIFEYQSESWVLLGSPIIGEAGGDESGWAVSLSYNGNIVAIGAPHNDGTNGDNSGHIRVYEYVSNEWTQMGDDIDGESAGDRSGWSVSLSNDGKTVAICARYNDGIKGTKSGHTRIYKYNGSTWTQYGQDLDGEDENDNSGWSVSLSGDGNIVAVGAIYNDNVNGDESGHVRIYEFDSTKEMWSQLGDDIDGEARNDNSGWSVSLSSGGTVVAVGAPYNDGNGDYSGHVRIYKFDGNAWVQVGVDIDGEKGGDYSGDSVSLSGDGTRVVIGAPGNDVNGLNSGHIRVYELAAT